MLQEFGDQPQIERIKERLWGEREPGRATVMVGSGFSRNAEARSSSVGPFPLWSEVAVAMRDALYPTATTPEDGRRWREQRYGSVTRGVSTLQRGIWNLALIHHAPSVGGARPLNHVLPGPVESLHHPGGEAVSWAVWYDPEYLGPVRSLQAGRLRRHWEKVREYEEIARAGLSSSRYRPDVERAVRDYARILDGRDPEAARSP